MLQHAGTQPLVLSFFEVVVFWMVVNKLVYDTRQAVAFDGVVRCGSERSGLAVESRIIFIFNV